MLGLLLLPMSVDKQFQRRETGLIGHFAAAIDPISQINKGQTHRLRLPDLEQDRLGAETTLGLIGVEKRVDRGQPIEHPVGYSDRH